MKIGINSPLRGNLRKLFRPANERPFPEVIGTFMGRDALSLAVSYLNLNANSTVLLPAYLCREVLKPFLCRTRVQFYDVRSDLSVDPKEIESRLRGETIKVLLIINYFGFLQPYRKEIREMCVDRGAILIEDCAHSLLTEGSGETGDLSVYSFRKTLPLPDGGGLKVNLAGETVNPNFYPQIYSNVLSVLIILKFLINVRSDTLSRAGLSSQKRTLFPSVSSNKKDNRILPLSSFAYNGLGNASLSENIEKRRSDYQFWQDLAERTKRFSPVFNHLPSGVCPLGFPARVEDRDQLKFHLQKEGIEVKIHWHLPSAIGGEFVNSHELSMHTLTLPVHPELGGRDRDVIERALTSKYGLRQ